MCFCELKRTKRGMYEICDDMTSEINQRAGVPPILFRLSEVFSMCGGHGHTLSRRQDSGVFDRQGGQVVHPKNKALNRSHASSLDGHS